MTAEMTKRTRKMKNRILAMPAADAAIPPNPSTAAITATTRKTSVQLSMTNLVERGPARKPRRAAFPRQSTDFSLRGSTLNDHGILRLGRVVVAQDLQAVPVDRADILHHVLAIDLDHAEGRPRRAQTCGERA